MRDTGAGFQTAGLDDRAWRSVRLPHDWSIEDVPGGQPPTQLDPFDKRSKGGTATAFTVGGEGWYRKHFRVDTVPMDARVEIAFDGVYLDTEVWLNKRRVGGNVNGYIPFAFDLTPFLDREGDNVLAVHVRNIGRNSRWYSGSGIYRQVRIDVLSPVARVARWGVGAWTRRIDVRGALIDATTEIEGDTTGLMLTTRLRDQSGRSVAEASAPGSAKVAQALSVRAPRLWSPDSPALYTLETELRRGGKVIDRVTQFFGVRIVTMDVQVGMAINGKPTKLRGGCIHHDNGLNFLATLPDAWNRKYLQFGCFGHCGFFSLNDSTSALVTIVAQGYPGQILQKGYASFGTDEGHDSQKSGAWAIKGPGEIDDDAVNDFLYRADKTLAETGKAFTRAFYAQATRRTQTIAYSYFCGCSGGGRDAMVAASYFPEEFDGIIAGSPYFNMANVGFQAVGNYLAALRSLSADVPPELVARIDPVVKTKCDAIDGVRDGLIQNPAACDFRADRDLPRCTADRPGADCFTGAQIETISALLTAVTDREGRLVQPGFSVSEVLPFFRTGASPAGVTARVPWSDTTPGQDNLATLGEAVIKTFANRNDPTFDTRALYSFGAGGSGTVTAYRAMVPRQQVTKVQDVLRQGIGDDPRKLAKFIAGNRKLLIWHNLSDEKLTPYMSINYYKRLAELHGGYDKLGDDVRLFLIPGTSHCSIGAVGPGNFDALSALEDWVEKQRSPDGIVASLYSRTSPMIDPAKTPLRTMPLCKFPEMARYDGHGDVNVAASWTCVPGDKRMLQIGESGRQAGVTS